MLTRQQKHAITKLVHAGLKDHEIAKELGLRVRAVFVYAETVRVSPHQVNIAKTYHHRGWSNYKIAKRLNKTEHAIASVIGKGAVCSVTTPADRPVRAVVTEPVDIAERPEPTPAPKSLSLLEDPEVLADPGVKAAMEKALASKLVKAGLLPDGAQIVLP